jgi:hypothetical protein
MKDFTQLYADTEDLLALGWDEGRSRRPRKKLSVN